MPSPFPGMDPYLEGSLWTTVHSQLIAEIARELAPQLRPRYLALNKERLVVQPLYEVGIMPTLIPQWTVEILDVVNRELVTAIEILLRANKQNEGREEYLAQRERIFLRHANLVEIDLLRKGQRVLMKSVLPSTPYFAFVSRWEKRAVVAVWPISLQTSLPQIPIPLLAGDADATLDLQRAFTTVFDAIGYDLAIDYRQPAEVPLDADESAWADALLRAAGRQG